MISFLRGQALRPDVILVGGVGYQVITPAPLPTGEQVERWVHTTVRDNDITLYAFSTEAERALFAALTKVPAVGGRTAVNVVALGADVVAHALATQDVTALTRAPGIGPKSARAILAGVSLDEATLTELGANPTPSVIEELTDALTAMGHDRTRARTAVTAAHQGAPDADHPTLLRTALVALAR